MASRNQPQELIRQVAGPGKRPFGHLLALQEHISPRWPRTFLEKPQSVNRPVPVIGPKRYPILLAYKPRRFGTLAAG